MIITAEEKLLETVDSKLQTVITNTASSNLNTDQLEAHHITAHGLLTTHNNSTIRDINNTNEIGDGSSNTTTVALGYDRSNGKARALLVDSNGKLEVSGAGGGDASASNQTSMITKLTSIDNTLNSDGTGALMVRLDNGNDSVRITGQNSSASSKGIGVEDTDGAVLSGAKVVVADPTSADGSRQVLRMNVKNQLLVKSQTRATGELYASQSLSAQSFSSASIDLSDYKQIHLFGQNTDTSYSFPLYIYGSQTSSGTYYWLGSLNGTLALNNITENAVSKNYYDLVIDNPPPFIKIRNNDFNSTTFELDFVGTKV